MRRYIPYFLWFFLSTSTVWQGIAQSGLILDENGYDSMPAGDVDKIKAHVVPGSYSLKAYAPIPGNQGNVASCVGWAIGYGALTMERAIAEGITDRQYITREMAHSALYLYQHVKRGSDCKALSSIPDALQFIHERGDCLEKTLSSTTFNCNQILSDQVHTEAQQFKITSTGYRVFNSQASAIDKVKMVKAHLSAGHPVIVGMSVTPPYKSLLQKEIWPIETNNLGGHAMIVVGYSDETQRFELMNSFGQSWGQKGFIEVSYTDFAEFCAQAFVLNNDVGTKGNKIPRNQHEVDLATKIIVESWNSKTDSFETVAFQSDEQFYRPDQPINLFQPVKVKVQVENARCAYLFNLDNNGQIDHLWSMEYPVSDTLVEIPDQGWWEFSNPGNERFCLLYGYEQIRSMDQFLNELKMNPEKNFYNKMMAINHVQYCSDSDTEVSDNNIFVRSHIKMGKEKFVPVFFMLNISDQ